MSNFGDKIKVEQCGFMIDGDLHSAYYPLIEVDGKFVYIQDTEYKTNKINADTRYKAKKLGEECLKRFKTKEDCK